MKNALILHGAANNSQGNWFPWLKGQLEEKVYKVWSPDLPHVEHPEQREWLEAIFSNKDWEFNQDSIIIGHSSGGTLALRILEQLSDEVKISKTILVAAPIDKGSIPEIWELKEGVTEAPYNWEKIKNSCQQFYLVYSDNDQYDCGIRHAKVIHEKVGGEIIFKPGQGHFNLESDPPYKEFSFLLTLID